MTSNQREEDKAMRGQKVKIVFCERLRSVLSQSVETIKLYLIQYLNTSNTDYGRRTVTFKDRRRCLVGGVTSL